MWDLQFVVTVATAVSVAGGVFWVNKKLLSEANRINVDAMVSRVETLERRLNRVESENTALRIWAELLAAQVIKAGVEPVPFATVKEKFG